MAGKGGGAWKVAYADFVTAMMAFFLVMWIVGQSKEVKQSVAKYFNDPFMVPSKHPGGASIYPSKDPPNTGRMERAKNNPKPREPSGEKKNRVRLADTKSGLFVLHDGKDALKGTVVQFAETSADLTDGAKAQLKEFSPALLGQPNKIEIRGHTTGRPPAPGSPFRDVWQLAYARCTATMDYLVELGVEPKRIRMSQAGPYEPDTIRITADWEKRNSRVEVYMLDELAEDLIGTREERDERFQPPVNE